MKHPRPLILCATLLALPLLASAAGFELSSLDIAPGARLAEAQVFKGFGCDGGNRSPALNWHGAPAGTQSYAVTVYDPDAPTGSGWWHWVVYNLPAATTSLSAGAGDTAKPMLPAGAAQGRTDFGRTGFGGACPPPGDKPHRYIFTVHALGVPKLALPADATAAMVGYMIQANRLGSATLEASYGR
ncbi:YbhB/YbcL family Raf kinase inhibitor-like protein [Ideonella azotifigens]|uniref:YbhB/YbcL family Raf kinase inhibitor-like protein n=2 Tax=Ideonella azotifigens TaxID=513160 RepID=A0ABN1KKH3_9BURK|nr:YbhB/YbcL family Raf kinase inhibitor-like protein [Ideonella azotifigens]MCD2339227.1 YbhB/YbcL family Raf kinase inhibitor-like protein [Ideonella azotifigens]